MATQGSYSSSKFRGIRSISRLKYSMVMPRKTQHYPKYHNNTENFLGLFKGFRKKVHEKVLPPFRPIKLKSFLPEKRLIKNDDNSLFLNWRTFLLLFWFSFQHIRFGLPPIIDRFYIPTKAGASFPPHISKLFYLLNSEILPFFLWNLSKFSFEDTFTQCL